MKRFDFTEGSWQHDTALDRDASREPASTRRVLTADDCAERVVLAAGMVGCADAYDDSGDSDYAWEWVEQQRGCIELLPTDNAHERAFAALDARNDARKDRDLEKRHSQRTAIPTISPSTIALYSFFDGALRFDADATIDGVRNPEAGEALASWAAMRGFSAVVSIVTPTIDSLDMRPYEVVRVQIIASRIAVLCARYVDAAQERAK